MLEFYLVCQVVLFFPAVEGCITVGLHETSALLHPTSFLLPFIITPRVMSRRGTTSTAAMTVVVVVMLVLENEFFSHS
jgi:hypothetical protein